jgi:cytidine deaminase
VIARLVGLVVVNDLDRRTGRLVVSLPDAEFEFLIAAAEAVRGEFALHREFTAGAVAAAIRGRPSGTIYTGICVEVACGIGFCAEHAAVAEMLKHRETEIESCVSVGRHGIVPPCGRCRELMAQINLKNLETRILVKPELIMPLRELMPAFWLTAHETM